MSNIYHRIEYDINKTFGKILDEYITHSKQILTINAQKL